ncbi:MAG: UbiA family prenyltransferase [Verrucomicrobia bacterium]|nr:UbiA family prenyltransferase [Verrucomicrobiota bacterium]
MADRAISPAPVPRSPARLWLDLARAGNFPSVWSNVLAALVLSSPVAAAWPAPGLLLLAFLAGSLAYAGGTTLNDVFDAGFDRQHRPERAIPRGLISRATAGWVGGLQLALGLGLLVFLGASPLAAAGLAATILLYDWLHKRWAGSVVLMAGCRVMLAVTLATLPGHAMTPAFVGWITALFVYIIVLSILARREYHPGAPAEKLGKIVRKLLAFIPFVDAAALLVVVAWIPAVCCAVAVPLGRWAQRMAASG